MRIALACLLSASALLAACSPKGEKAAEAGSAPAAGAPAPPARLAKPRAGLWRNTMVMAGPVGMTVHSEVCLDDAMLKGDDWMSADAKAGGPDCTSSYEPTAAGYTVHSVCKFSGRTVTTEGVASGDFKSHYKVAMTSTTDPVPQGMPAQTQMSVDAQWIGDCAPGQKGGVVSTQAVPAKHDK